MKREELDALLKELVTPETDVERGLEIVKQIQDDKDKSIAQLNDLISKSDKLQDDYKALQAKRVDEFFNKGTDFDPSKDDPQYTDTSKQDNEEEKMPTYDDIVSEMIGE